jgi:hypothetical protein
MESPTQPAAPIGSNLGPGAHVTTSFVSGHENLAAVHDGFEPADVNDHSHGAYGNWPQTGTQWVQYEWSQPISTQRVDVYWWDDSRGIRLPKACRLSYWDGKAFVAVQEAKGLGVLGGHFNTTTFKEVLSSKLRLEFDSSEKFSTGILEWKVIDTGKSPAFPPTVVAGIDRVVILREKTYLSGQVESISGGEIEAEWIKESGPGLSLIHI